MIRAVTHIHTRYSYDSVLAPRTLVRRLAAMGIRLALVADHDTFAGAIATRREAEVAGLDLIVPVAAEVLTELGDVIAIFDEPPAAGIVGLKSWNTLVNTVRAAGGVIWLPHPFHGHSQVERMAREAEVIEVFNSRCTAEENRAADALCRREKKLPAYAADAHRLVDCMAVVVEYPEAVKAADVFKSPARRVVANYTPRSAISLTQAIKGVKQRRPGLAMMSLASYVARVLER